ncbi:MAG: AAA family ATPase [Thermoplasmata archaeon]|nr:AAA family ATPase [Thermoplasmata archaeon]
MKIKVPRSEATEIKDSWIMLYGRRKIGKTFMIKNFVKWDYYFLIGQAGTIWCEGTPIKKFTILDDFMEFLIESLHKGKSVVVDEFQRLPFEMLERISSEHPNGQLILSGSSMAIVKKIFGVKSPLLGLLKEHKIGLIHHDDIIKKISLDNMVDYATYLRDPWLIPNMEGSDILRDLYNVLSGVRYTIPALLGEIFHEEDRSISEIFEGILGAIGSGYGKPSEIASILYNRGVINRDAPSHVVPYIRNLIDMDIIKQIKIFKKKRTIYRMVSPIFSIFYYMNDKYGLERGIPPFSVVENNLIRAHSFSVEDFIVTSLTHSFNGEVRYSYEPEIDGIIVDRRERPLAVIEVKWGRISKKDIDSYLDKIEELGIGGKKILITKKSFLNNEILVLDPKKLRDILLGNSDLI